MDQSNTPANGKSRNVLAYAILIFSGSAITILALVAIIMKPADTMTILNTVFPVLASWVGTILAFYFGRENFESANKQVREMVEKLTPEQRAKSPVTAIMRKISDMEVFEIPQGKGDQDFKIVDLQAKFTKTISRLPVVEAGNKPKYMIHQSRIVSHLNDGGNDQETLEVFLTKRKQAGDEFGLDKGFILASENTTIDVVKQKLKDFPSCQDVFVTKDGKPDQSLVGWISNVRLAKFLEP